MKTFIDPAVDAYAAAHCAKESPLLKALVRQTRLTTAAPQMQVGRLEGAFLRLLVRMTRARRVLEIGTFTGYSALAMAEGLPSGGRLVTCDVDPVATALARKYWSKSAHGRKIELRLGPALDTLKRLPGPFDLAFIDAEKTNYLRYWEAVVPRMRRGGLIAVDNVLWSGSVLAPKEPSARTIAALNRRAASDRRVETALLTVRDGVLLAWKR
ncbi:MAG: class I SAM-dependent methyltransferase [Elusimicrobia bacterium]|nr:class I SAM-dependent methyltransferase [Elusimicrobiota bacterium]